MQQYPSFSSSDVPNKYPYMFPSEFLFLMQRHFLSGELTVAHFLSPSLLLSLVTNKSFSFCTSASNSDMPSEVNSNHHSIAPIVIYSAMNYNHTSVGPKILPQ